MTIDEESVRDYLSRNNPELFKFRNIPEDKFCTLLEKLQWGLGLLGTPKNLKLHFWADFRVFITMGNPIIGRNFRFYRCRIFKNGKVFGEKNEKSKIASQDFKQ